MLKLRTISAFVSGLLASSEFIEALTGEPLRDTQPATLNDYDLVMQKLEDIPDPARTILAGAWGNSFESYNLTPGTGNIKGVRCRLTQDQWSRIQDWEFVNEGWYEFATVSVTNNVTGYDEIVEALVMQGKQPYSRVVEEGDHEMYVMPKESLLEIARKTRQLYDERTKAAGETVHASGEKRLF